MEQNSHSNKLDLQNLRDLLHTLEGEIAKSSEKITLETYLRNQANDKLKFEIAQVRACLKSH